MKMFYLLLRSVTCYWMIIGVRKIGTISEVPLLVSPPRSSVDMSDSEIVR